jgi:aldose 1-epimerase
MHPVVLYERGESTMNRMLTKLLLASILVTLFGIMGSHQDALAADSKLGLSSAPWGKTADGQDVTAYTLTNDNNITATLIDYGAILVSLETPDRDGDTADIVLGCDTVDCYATKSPYFGATIGRYANRIAGGKFSIDGTEYTLVQNNGPNHLHGGTLGYDKVVWSAEEVEVEDGVGVTFSYTSPDGEEGYPGTVDIKVTYRLTNDDEILVAFHAVTDKTTPINLTNHSYWNLGGHDSGTNYAHEVQLNASRYTPGDDTLIPTGEIAQVAGTGLDFTTPHKIGERIDDVEGGYDHNYVLDGAVPGNIAATVYHPGTGRVLTVATTEPGIQFYSGNFLDGSFDGKGGTQYQKHAAFCLEPQKFPDTPNKPSFPSALLHPGETYKHTITFKFFTR